MATTFIAEATGMLPLAHVVLHIGFCQALMRAPETAPVAARVHVTDRIGRVQFDRTFHFQRGDENEAIVEFDNAFGLYRLDIAAPRYGCSATEYVYFIPGHDRSIAIALRPGPVTQPPMPVLLSGAAPQSFLYLQPTFVLLDKSKSICKQPVPEPLQTDIIVENDQDSYYAWLFADPQMAIGSLQLALRLRTPTHQYHYVRIPMQFPVPRGGWPESITLDVTEDMADGLATEPTNTLLCPKMWKTSAG
jgi:hypothetical protein